MKILVGLGNPGKEYKNTRHNAGFMVVDKMVQGSHLRSRGFTSAYSAVFAPGCFGGQAKFKMNKKMNAEIGEFEYQGEKVVLVKPQTFMNESGVAVRKIVKLLNCSIASFPHCLWLVHDDLDLKLGEIKIVKDSGPAGHKGVQSVIDHLKTQDFVRFRVGINKIKSEKLKVKSCEDYVLGKFKGEEKKKFEKVIEKCAGAVIFGLENGIKEMMNEYN